MSDDDGVWFDEGDWEVGSEGFEADLDELQRRGAFNGWRQAGLPWIQD